MSTDLPVALGEARQGQDLEAGDEDFEMGEADEVGDGVGEIGAEGRFDRFLGQMSARKVRDPCRGRMLITIGFRWRRAFGACHRLMSVTPPAWDSRQD